MLITIDTNAVTEKDLEILTLVFDRKTEVLKADNDAAEAAPEISKPITTRRPRRTKAQIEADEAQAKAEADAAIAESKRLRAAAADEAAAATTEEPSQTDQELTDALDKESAATELKATIEQVVEAASKLIATDKAKMRAILDSFGARKVSDVPEDKLGELLAAIKSA